MEVLNTLIKDLPDIEIKNAIIGAFDTAVLSRHWGMASTLKLTPCNASHCGGISDAGNLIGMPVKKVAELSLSRNLLEASLGLAAINSAIEINEENITEINALDILTEHGLNKNVAVIGHFPFVNKLKTIAGKLYIIEKSPQPGDMHESMTEDILLDMDVVAITATSLANHTFETIMNSIKPSAFVIMLGPSTPLSKVMFDFGINVLSGSLISDEPLALKYITQGASYKQINGVRRVTMVKE